MTKKDFFILMIKLFGLYWIIASISSGIFTNVSLVLADLDAIEILWIVLAIVAVIGLFVLLVFQSDKIVKLLKLDKGFDDNRIEFENLKSIDIIKIGTFIIGGFLVLDNIPIFISHSLYAFKVDVAGTQYHNPQNNFYWLISALDLLIGYLLLTQYDFVAKKFTNKKGK